MFKGLSGLGSLLKQAQQITGRMQEMNEELRNRRATGTAGGGMVEVEVNGLVEALRCKIDPQLLSQGDAEMIEDLVVAAVNQAITQAKQLHAEALKSVTGGMALPGLDQAMGRFFGEGAADAEPSPTAQSGDDTPHAEDQLPRENDG